MFSNINRSEFFFFLPVYELEAGASVDARRTWVPLAPRCDEQMLIQPQAAY